MHNWGPPVLQLMITESFNSPKTDKVPGTHDKCKPFLPIEEQVELLKSRNLTINNEQYAKDILEDSNYYRFSGYSLTLRKKDHFFEGVSFETIEDIYNCDQALRSLLFHYLQIIEVRVKSVYAYEFAKMYGPTSYTDPANFKSGMTDQELKNILEKPTEMRQKRLNDELFLKHYQGVDLLPIWIFIELFTFGDISRIYAVSSDELKRAVLVSLRKDHKNTNNFSYLESNLRCLTTLRNFCAHGSRLFHRVFYRKPSLYNKELSLLKAGNSISDKLYGYKTFNPDNSHLYGFIIVMKRFLRDNVFSTLKNSILELKGKYPTVDMGYYGFPKGWESAV